MNGNARVLGILGAVGLGLIGVAGNMARQTEKFLQTAISADGLVAENVKKRWRYPGGQSTYETYYPRVSFRTKDGLSVVFTSNKGASSPEYRRHQTVPVVYDPRQPHHASTRSFRDQWGPSTFALGLGIFCWLPGIVFLISRPIRRLANARRARRMAAENAAEYAWLLQNGRRIQAHHPRVELNGSVRIEGSHPYRITCEWRDPATNRMLSFCSGNISYDPTGLVSINQIDVLIDPNNPDHYLVDTSFLPLKR